MLPLKQEAGQIIKCFRDKFYLVNISHILHVKVMYAFKSHVLDTNGKSILLNITLEEIEILKAASSKHLLNDVIAGQNDPIYKLLPTSVV